MELKELKERIGNSLSAITGEDSNSVSSNNLNEILKVFAKQNLDGTFVINTNDEVIIKSLNIAPKEYYGSTKIPPPSFWHRIKRDIQSRWNGLHKSSTDGYKRPQGQEKEQIVNGLARIAASFDSKAVQIEQKQNFADSKAERYRGYIEADIVRVEDVNSEINDTWIKREKAIEIGVTFHDPVMWFENRFKKSDVSRETFSI